MKSPLSQQKTNNGEERAEMRRKNARYAYWLASVWHESVVIYRVLPFFISVLLSHGLVENLQVTLRDFCEFNTHSQPCPTLSGIDNRRPNNLASNIHGLTARHFNDKSQNAFGRWHFSAGDK